MNQNKNINIDGNITHKIKRSLELAPEIIKLESRKRSNRGINSPLIILYGLVLFIILGTILLFLPFSTKTGENISLVDSSLKNCDLFFTYNCRYQRNNYY